VFDHPGVVLNAVGTWVSTVGLTHSGSLAAVFNDPSTVAGTGLEVLDELRSGGLLLRTRRPLATRLADFAAQVTPGTDPARWIADWIVQEPETVTVAANGVGLDLAGLRPVIAHARARYPDAFGNVSELTPGLTAEFATRRGASLDGHVVHLAAPLLSEPAASTGRPDPSTPPSSPEATALALATRPTSDGWSPPVSASSDPMLRHALLADVTERVVGWGDLTDEEFWSRVAADEGVRAVSVGGRTVPFTLIADWARQCGLTAPIQRGGFIEWLHESNIEDFGLRLLTSAAGAGVTLAVPPAPDDAWMADAGSAYRQFILARWPDGTSEDVDPIRVLVEFLYAWPAADGPLARGVDIKQLVSHLAGQLPVQTRHLARLPEHLSQTSRQTQYRRSVSGLRGMVYANGLYSLIDAPEVGVRQAEVAGGEALAVAAASGNRTRVLAGGNDLPWLPPIAADAQREFLEPMTPS
jgi:hypothetical protein